MTNDSEARVRDSAEETRTRLERAADDLISGRVPGPLTGVRLVEVAGVKRHRLTHDNPDINAAFQAKVRELNRHRPEVDRLRRDLLAERVRSTRLATENSELKARVAAYAAAILSLTEERATSSNHSDAPSNVTPLAPRDR